jgi:hypothetical protein
VPGLLHPSPCRLLASRPQRRSEQLAGPKQTTFLSLSKFSDLFVQGRTFQVSPLSWLRESSVSPANKRGLLNASVVTTLSTTGAPTLVEANYSYNGQTIAYHSCHFESFLSPGGYACMMTLHDNVSFVAFCCVCLVIMIVCYGCVYYHRL